MHSSAVNNLEERLLDEPYKLSTLKGKSKSSVLRKLFAVMFVCIIFMGVEIVGGLLAHSIAILSDAAHLLSDMLGFVISIISVYISVLPANKQHSYGFHRAGVIGALASVILIWGLTGFLLYFATERVMNIDSIEVEGKLMFCTASFGLLANLVMMKVLHGGHGHSHGHDHGHDHGHKHEHSHDHKHNHKDKHHSHDHSHDEKKTSKDPEKKINLDLENGEPNSKSHKHDHSHDHDHDHDHSHEHEHTDKHEHKDNHDHSHEHDHDHDHDHEHKHDHKHDHDHDHDHNHNHNHVHDHDHKHDHEHNHEHEGVDHKVETILVKEEDIYCPCDDISPLKSPMNEIEENNEKKFDSPGKNHEVSFEVAPREKNETKEKPKKKKGHSHSHGHDHDHGDLNIRAAAIHIIGDIVQSIGVMIASALIWYDPTLKLADPICTYIFSIIALFTTTRVAKECISVLMEATPEELEVEDFEESLRKIPGVIDVHDLHVWSLSAGKTAMSAHILTNKDAQCVLKKATKISRFYGVYHTTIQVENVSDKLHHHFVDCQNDLH